MKDKNLKTENAICLCKNCSLEMGERNQHCPWRSFDNAYCDNILIIDQLNEMRKKWVEDLPLFKDYGKEYPKEQGLW